MVRNLVISGIYRATHKETGKVYIGQSLNIYERWKAYQRFAKNKNRKDGKRYFARALQKYGFEAFTWEVLKVTYDLDYWEKFFIQMHHSTDSKFGYNIQVGGQNRIFDTPNGELVKDKIRSSVLSSDKVKSGIHKYFVEEGGFRGHFTEEQYKDWIDKNRKAHLGKKWSKESLEKRSATVSKKVKCLNDGMVFNSTKECDYYYRKILNVNRIHVTEVCQGKRAQCHGLRFIFI